MEYEEITVSTIEAQRPGILAERPRRQIVHIDEMPYEPPLTQQRPDLPSLFARFMEETIQSLMPRLLIDSHYVCRSAEPETKAVFDTLAATWKTEAAACSTVIEMVTRPSYQRIIGMGKIAIPYILSALSREPDHWFWALKAISGEDPVALADRGDLRKMTKAWLIWGARSGYVF